MRVSVTFVPGKNGTGRVAHPFRLSFVPHENRGCPILCGEHASDSARGAKGGSSRMSQLGARRIRGTTPSDPTLAAQGWGTLVSREGQNRPGKPGPPATLPYREGRTDQEPGPTAPVFVCSGCPLFSRIGLVQPASSFLFFLVILFPI